MSESKWELSAVAEWAKVRMCEHSARSTNVWFGRVSSLAVSSALSSCYTCRGSFVGLFAVCVSTLTFISEERFTMEIISRFPKKQNLNKVDCQRSNKIMCTVKTQNPWTVKWECIITAVVLIRDHPHILRVDPFFKATKRRRIYKQTMRGVKLDQSTGLIQFRINTAAQLRTGPRSY